MKIEKEVDEELGWLVDFVFERVTITFAPFAGWGVDLKHVFSHSYFKIGWVTFGWGFD